MPLQIRKFSEDDIPYKVKWINDHGNNSYLSYDLPLREDQTLLWYRAIVDRTDRADYTITCDDEPVGLIGLLNIDDKNKKAEYYIVLGGASHKGKGVADIAISLLMEESFGKYGLSKVYAYVEIGNKSAQRMCERMGFIKEGLLREDISKEGKRIDRFVYGLLVQEWCIKQHSPSANRHIYSLDECQRQGDTV